MILRVIYRDTLLLNLVKISQWILNWLELVHQASFCPSKSSWSPSFTWNLRTSSNWISLLHPLKINMEPQKLPLYLYYVYMFYSMFLVIFEVCAIFSPPPPPKEKTMFSRYMHTYTYAHLYFFHGVNIHITNDLSNDILHHHQVARYARYAAPTWNFYAAMHCDLEAHLRHREKTHMETDVFFGLGWCDGPSISGKISMKNWDFSEKKQDETQRCCLQNSRKRGSFTCHSFFESTLGDWKLRKYRLWPGVALHGSNMVEFWVSDFISLSKWEIPPWNYYFQWGCKRSM